MPVLLPRPRLTNRAAAGKWCSSSTPVGGVLLWLLVIGFIGMALWRLSEALWIRL
jgi:Domain of Unknown Function (DUF1206)